MIFTIVNLWVRINEDLVVEGTNDYEGDILLSVPEKNE